MKVRIGIAEIDKIVELEVDDPVAFERTVAEAFSGQSPMLWFEDHKHRRVGIPRERVGYVEIETESERGGVGFSRNS